MANENKKLVTEITSMDEDFAKWYTDIVKKADLVDYSGVKGCMIIRPYGYAIWENIQKILDGRFKETGVENVYMPMFIPESLLTKEKEHVEGFAPEVAWVTQATSGANPSTCSFSLVSKDSGINMGIYTFSTPLSLNLVSRILCMFSQIA